MCKATRHACKCVAVRLHNDSWCSCSGGLRSWERHEAITQRCVPLSGPDAPIALRLGQPGSSTVLTQLSRLPAAFSIKVRGVEPPERSQGTPEELCSTLCQRHCRNSWGNTSDFLCYCSQHPTFLLQRSHPTTHTQTPASSPHPTPLAILLTVFLFPFFFLLPGSNQEKIRDQRLPISSGEWHSVVWVSTLLLPGTLKPLIHMEALCSPPGLRCNVSVTDISQADPLPGHCLFVSHIK